MTDDTKVIDAEIVETTEAEPAENDSGSSSVSELAALEAMVSRKISQIEELKEKAKNAKEQLESVIDNDPLVQEAGEKAKEAVKAVSARKTQLGNTPQVKTIKENVSDLTQTIKDTQDSLNENLLALYKLTGSSQFQTLAGDTREFKLLARLLPKKRPPLS